MTPRKPHASWPRATGMVRWRLFRFERMYRCVSHAKERGTPTSNYIVRNRARSSEKRRRLDAVGMDAKIFPRSGKTPDSRERAVAYCALAATRVRSLPMEARDPTLEGSRGLDSVLLDQVE